MAVKKSLLKETLDGLSKDIKTRLKDKEFYDLIIENGSETAPAETGTEGIRLSEKGLRAAQAFESAFTTYAALFNDMGTLYNIPKKEEKDYDLKKRSVENSFAMYVACMEGLDVLGKYTSIPNESGLIQADFDRPGMRLFDDTISSAKITLNTLVEKKNRDKRKLEYEGADAPDWDRDENLLLWAGVFLKGLANRCLVEKDKHPELVGYLEQVELELNGHVYNGFTSSGSTGGTQTKFTNATLGEVTFDKIIGNDVAIEKFKSIADSLLFYDPETKKNPIKEYFDLPRTMLAWGKPGTGKTLTLQALANYIQTRAKEAGKEKNVLVKNISHDVKNEYFGKTEENLRKQFAEATGTDKISLIYIEDIDGLMPDRSEMHNNPALKAMFTQVLDIMQGINTEYYGNYVIIATTNRPEGLDAALYQRLKEYLVEFEGPKGEQQMIDALRIHLRKGLDGGYISISDEDWEEFGKIAVEKKFAGRDIEKFSKHVYSLATTDGLITPDMFKMPPEKLKETIFSKMKKIDGKAVIDEAKRYSDEDEYSKERGERERHNDMVKTLLDQHRAQKDADKEITKLEMDDPAIREQLFSEINRFKDLTKAEFKVYGEDVSDEEALKLTLDKKYYEQRKEEIKKAEKKDPDKKE
ncbi:MAG: ATP-binding protein [Candidatus Aenigmarchaeota archaeon]|nr:ATP-binding protein [Candidatus Aenigmarchaeota archaeon]